MYKIVWQGEVKVCIAQAKRELMRKAASRPFWGDPLKILGAVDKLDSDLTCDLIAYVALNGLHDHQTLLKREAVKALCARCGLSRAACAAISCALAHAARKARFALARD